MTRTVLVSFLVIFFATAHAGAQQASPTGIVEGVAGYTGFGDDGLIHHFMAGASARVGFLDRLHAGPEVVYMIGPGADRDLCLTGTLTFDIVSAKRAAIPYLLVNAGWMFHSSTFGTDGGRTFTIGAGARVNAGGRMFVAPEVRLGGPPQIRFALSIGSRF
jgi:hypothetical protein